MDPSARSEDGRSLLLVAAALSAVVATVGAVRDHVARSLGEAAVPARPNLDAAVGVLVSATAVAMRGGRMVLGAVRPAAGFVLRPPLVPERLQPMTWLQAKAQEGRVARVRATPVLEGIVPAVVPAVLDRIDLTALVLDRVKLGQIIDEVDVNGIVERVDLVRIVDRLPIDRIIERLDVDAIVARVDIDAVAARIDLDRVIERIDLAALAREVIDDIDLPEIIRESTGVMTSEAVVGMRMQGIQADERLSQIVDRVLLRNSQRKTQLRTPSGTGDETPG